MSVLGNRIIDLSAARIQGIARPRRQSAGDELGERRLALSFGGNLIH